MDPLRALENRSIYIIREAYRRFPEMAMLWSIGKDSTTLLWLVRKAFFGRVPFPVIHIDTSYKFSEIYQFRAAYAKKWQLDLLVVRNEEALATGMCPESGTLACCSALKTDALRQAVQRFGFRALLLGIRRDEHGIRAKERYFSPRDNQFRWDYRAQPIELWDLYMSQPNPDEHVRVHPLLHWREIDVWSYVKGENIPVVGLYFARNGQRYRSIGCRTCCRPVPSHASDLDAIIVELRSAPGAERSGRAQDKESTYAMQKLRSLGYM